MEMVKMGKVETVKITVLKRFSPSEVFETSPVTPEKEIGPCELLKDGQEFIVDKDSTMPENFCGSAWQVLFANVRALASGANFPWYKEKGIAVTCCPDGLRPVVFKLERTK
jgi:uncharacterized repeat protein (TIGR04076 family)